MRDEINKEIVLHCLKSTSDFHGEICEECPIYSKCDHTWQSEVYEKAIELIEGQWIPVEERLPEDKINLYTNDYYMYPVIFKLCNFTEVSFYSFGKGHWYDEGFIMDDYVKAWMPLPSIDEQKK